jgi:predicted metalloprotease with PDZ domain
MLRKRTLHLLALGVLTLATVPRPMAAAEEAPDECAAELSQRVRGMVSLILDRGWIGVELDEARPPMLTRVVAGGPAERAGVEVGDRWVGVAGFEFADHDKGEVMERLKEVIQPDHTFAIFLLRDDRRIELEITPVAVPRAILAQWIGGHLVEKYAADLLPAEHP